MSLEIEKIKGMYIKLPKVPKPKPHPKASVIGINKGSEPPTLYAVGNSPPIVVSVVNRIGRNLRRIASDKI